MIKFYKGNAVKYINRKDENNPNTNLTDDVIYFAEDSKEIFTDGKSFGKNADQSVTTEAITIEGGPLANSSIKEAFKQEDDNGNVSYEIPAGTSVQEILSTLLCNEFWPEYTPSYATLTTSVTCPSPQISANSKDGTLVEVGDTLTVAKLTAGNTTTGGTTTTSISGLTNGYGTVETTSANTPAPTKNANGTILTSISVNRNTPVVTENTKHSMTVTIDSGFTGASITQPTANAIAASVTCEAFTGTAILGTNKVSVSETGRPYTATVPALESVFIYSNLGNTKGHTTPKIEADNSLSAAAPSNSKNASVTGVYAIYSTGKLYKTFSTSANDADAWTNGQTSDYMNFSNKETPQRMKLTDLTSKTTQTTFYGYIGFGSDSPEESKIVLLPAGWKITSVHIPDSTVSGKWLTSSNQTAVRIKADDEAEAGFDFTNNSGATSTYTKWQIKGSTAANLFKLTITNK